MASQKSPSSSFHKGIGVFLLCIIALLVGLHVLQKEIPKRRILTLRMPRPLSAAYNSDVNATETSTDEFSLEASFQIPWSTGRDGEQLRVALWVKELRSFLKTVPVPGPVTLVSSDVSFKEVLINWLVAASVAKVEHVLIVTYDEHLSNQLTARGIISLHVPIRSVVHAGSTLPAPGRPTMVQLLVVRISVMRLLNYWGYDVANYDADAIILRNPKVIHEMYADSDLIGQYGGSLPSDLYQEWGVVMCMGAVLLIRSNTQTEHLWKAVTQLSTINDDQVKFNKAFKLLNISWMASNSEYTQEKEWQGETGGGLRVTLVPPLIACRLKLCLGENRNKYCVWHKGFKTRHVPGLVESQIKKDEVWFLQDNWRMLIWNSHLVGTAWLRSLEGNNSYSD